MLVNLNKASFFVQQTLFEINFPEKSRQKSRSVVTNAQDVFP